MTHLLLQADPGRADDVQTHLAALPHVTQAVVTSGPYDVIAVVESGADVPTVLARAKQAPGLARVCVCRPVGAPS